MIGDPGPNGPPPPEPRVLGALSIAVLENGQARIECSRPMPQPIAAALLFLAAGALHQAVSGPADAPRVLIPPPGVKLT